MAWNKSILFPGQVLQGRPLWSLSCHHYFLFFIGMYVVRRFIICEFVAQSIQKLVNDIAAEIRYYSNNTKRQPKTCMAPKANNLFICQRKKSQFVHSLQV